jgi:hypothetical protein
MLAMGRFRLQRLQPEAVQMGSMMSSRIRFGFGGRQAPNASRPSAQQSTR